MIGNKTFKKLLLENLRTLPIHAPNIPLTDERIAKAVTVNENLLSCGYTLTPKDVTVLAGSEDLDGFWADFKKLVPDVEAKPMYPDFPSQVLEMDEATYRFHQMAHYFSTYGLEELFGVEVKKGWMPDVEETEKTESDQTLVKAKRISLMDDESVYAYTIKTLLSKRERLTVPEATLVSMAVRDWDGALSALKEVNVTFKENLLEVSFQILNDCTREDSVPAVAALCQHAGDALRICDYCIGKWYYRLHTSQKRTLVRLLEQFSAMDLRTNLVISSKKAQRSHIVLNYTDFNEYCTKPDIQKVVNEFRDGGIRSWESQMKSLLNSDKDEALQFIAQKPGMMLRMVSWLLRIGYTKETLLEVLLPKADKLSMQTLVTNLNLFGADDYQYEKYDKDTIYDIFLALLKERMKSLETGLDGKKLFISEEEYCFDESVIECNTKSAEGGYIRSGIAYRLPDEAKVLRFFVYWNDSERVDIDLHTYCEDTEGEKIHIGWDEDFKNKGVYMSGDITHSDAAEFIDAEVDGEVERAVFNIHSFTGQPFGKIDTCFVGVMAVSDLAANVKLYDPKNCLFYHELKTNDTQMIYGYMDVKKKIVVFLGKPGSGMARSQSGRFNVSQYLKLLAEAQNFVITDNRDEADKVVVMGKADENEISLIDENFFLDK